MSATIGTNSRSSSPATSESLSDEQHNNDTLDFSAWCNLSPEPASESDGTSWNTEEQQDLPKMEESSLRMLEEMFRAQSQSFDPITPESAIGVNPAVFHLSQPQPDDKGTFSSSAFSNFSSDNSSSESAPVPELTPRTTLTTTMPTRVIPPPPVQPRKVDYSIHRRVIFPAKESCYNLTILTPNVPLCGTKSRVETQVRVALDLALPSGSSGDPQSYDRIGSWKWLKLPSGTATRKRSRKEGKIDASPDDTLFMDAEVTCASYPSKQVQSCSTCQGREAKRVARKIAARVRPARSDSDSNDGESGSSSKIVQFNCPDTLDFSGGSVVLPLRITCYCRHHREKLGFNVHFTMRDGNGRVIGKGMSPPIMITDDHKSTDKSASKQPTLPSYQSETDWNPRVAFDSAPRETVPTDSGAPSRRRQPMPRESVGASKKRAKPYDNGRTRRGGSSQPTIDTGGSPSSPSISDASILTPFSPFAPSIFTRSGPTSPESLKRESITSLPSPPISNQSPVSPQAHFMENTDAIMHDVLHQPYPFIPLSPPETAPSSPPNSASSSLDLPSFAFNMLHHSPDTPASSLPSPKIHRLIPAAGPTFGGIEVTVLGSNFHPSVLYNCVFGDVTASSTTRWSENTLVCILPPRATAGVVQVTLDGLKMDSSGAPALFTYLDETDRTLMELALQVVGLKMTGKIEDAKDIAMRIVGSSSQDSQGSSGSTTQIMNLANGALPDSRRLLLSRGDDVEFEKTIMDSLLSLDMRDSTGEPISLTSVISHPTKTGQTLLHLATLLKFPSLVEFLIQRDISLDAQDINGYTALHFAVLSSSPCCARQIINAGADISICSKMGYTALELAPERFLDPVQEISDSLSEESDEESHFGDIEEYSGNEGRPPSRPHSRRRIRHPRSRRSSMPASVASDASDVEDLFDARAAAEDDDNATVVSPESLPIGKDPTIDEKQAATFAEYLQRAWAQFQPPHLRPQMPHMPQFPGMPAWVFPVFVPMQAWPPFRIERHEEGNDEKQAVNDDGLRSPRAHWENFMAQMSAAMVRQGQLGESALDADQPKKFSVLADHSSDSHEGTTKLPLAPAPVASRSLLRRFGYNQNPIEVSEKEVKSYSYRPKTKSLAKPVNKEDRMLIIFWIPIMILVLGWALYASRPVISMLQQYLPWEDVTRRFSSIV